MALRDDYEYSQEELDNRSRQLDPENDAYWESRGYDERPSDWEELRQKYCFKNKRG